MTAGAGEAVTLSREEAESLGRRVLDLCTSPRAVVMVDSRVVGSTAFARNVVQGATDTQFLQVGVTSIYGAKSAAVYTNHIDDAGLQAAVARAEALAQHETVPEEAEVDAADPPGPVNPGLWREMSLANLDPAGRIGAMQDAIAAIVAAGQIGAGNLVTAASALAVLTNAGHFEYGRSTTTTYSVSARTTDGTGSGWAGWRGEDWSTVDHKAIAARAVDLAERTRNPIAIEPGHYTVVFSPVALGGLCWLIARFALNGKQADEGQTPFSRKGGGTKIGLKVFDERVTLLADPMDTIGGFLPFDYNDGELHQYSKVAWVERGVLQHLAYEGAYARKHGQPPLDNSFALHMVGGPTSIDEMIASTERGIYISRVSNVSVMVLRTLLLTGVTRDGTFLIEDGKITRPVRNFRFEDSPFFFLNNLESLGPAERVPIGGAPQVFPPAKVHDFALTSLSEAV